MHTVLSSALCYMLCCISYQAYASQLSFAQVACWAGPYFAAAVFLYVLVVSWRLFVYVSSTTSRFCHLLESLHTTGDMRYAQAPGAASACGVEGAARLSMHRVLLGRGVVPRPGCCQHVLAVALAILRLLAMQGCQGVGVLTACNPTIVLMSLPDMSLDACLPLFSWGVNVILAMAGVSAFMEVVQASGVAQVVVADNAQQVHQLTWQGLQCLHLCVLVCWVWMSLSIQGALPAQA